MIALEVLTYAIAFTAPYAVMRACSRSKALDAVGPIMILYGLGMIAGLLGLKSDAQTIISEITVPLAIPLILFGNSINLGGKGARDTVLAFVSCLVSAIVAVTASYAVFRPGTDVGGMVSGCVTGGTMNMASVKLALNADDATFVLLNTYDMTVSFVYMMVLLLFGIRLARKFLPVRTCPDSEDAISEEISTEKRKTSLKNYLTLFLAAVFCCAVAYGISMLFDESVFMLVFILALTSLGVAASYIRKIRTTAGSYDMGMYLVYVFSFDVASMADFRNMSLGENANMLGFFAMTIFGSLVLHMIISRILKIDADTAVIASNAFVNAPPSVPVIASAMKNRKALTSGLAIGIVGYAIGTYLGIVMSRLFGVLF